MQPVDNVMPFRNKRSPRAHTDGWMLTIRQHTTGGLPHSQVRSAGMMEMTATEVKRTRNSLNKEDTAGEMAVAYSNIWND